MYSPPWRTKGLRTERDSSRRSFLTPTTRVFRVPTTTWDTL